MSETNGFRLTSAPSIVERGSKNAKCDSTLRYFMSLNDKRVVVVTEGLPIRFHSLAMTMQKRVRKLGLPIKAIVYQEKLYLERVDLPENDIPKDE